MLKNKFLSAVLALAMVLAALPVTVFAAEGVTTQQALQQAIEEAPTGQTTTIQVDGDILLDQVVQIQQGQQIQLNLNGHTISVVADFEGRPILNSGTLTVYGGTIDTTKAQNGYGCIDNYGSLYIKDGVYNSNVLAGGSTIKNRPGSYCEIYDGSFYGSPTAVYNEGITKIYGGTFDGRSCSTCSSKSWGYTIQSHWNNKQAEKPQLYFYNGKVIGVQGAFSSSAGYTEIWDGSFVTVPCQVHPTNSWYALYIAGESGEIEAHVYGGTFTADNKYAVFVGNSNDGGEKQQAVAYLHGGTYTGGSSSKKPVYVDGQLGTLQITGGSYFNNDNTVFDVSSWLKEGYTQGQDGQVQHNHAAVATHVPNTDPTCTTDGCIEHWYCPECQLYFADKECTQQLTQQQVVLPATGHNYQGGVCQNCGDTIAVQTPDGVDDKVIADQVSQIINDIVANGSSNAVDSQTAALVQQALQNNQTITAKVELTTGYTPNDKDQQTIADTIGKDQLAGYFDLSVVLCADGAKLGNVTQLASPVAFTVAIPEGLAKEGRSFYVVRLHNGVAQKLDTVQNADGTLTFSTDKFSTYAIAYTDTTTTTPNTPNTGDNVDVMPIATALALGAAGVVVLAGKSKKDR